MGHTFEDFDVGDRVYHLSQYGKSEKQTMIVTNLNTLLMKVMCKWITPKGTPHCEEFKSFELDKLPRV